MLKSVKQSSSYLHKRRLKTLPYLVRKNEKFDRRRLRKRQPISDYKFALMTEILKDERTIKWIAAKYNTTTFYIYQLRAQLGINKKQKNPNHNYKRGIKKKKTPCTTSSSTPTPSIRLPSFMCP